MTYSEKLSTLREEVLTEFKRQFPTRHDYLDLLEEGQEDNREDVPMIIMRHKHYCFSHEYVLKIQNKNGEIQAVCEDPELSEESVYPIDNFTTGELCDILDTVIRRVIENKK